MAKDEAKAATKAARRAAANPFKVGDRVEYTMGMLQGRRGTVAVIQGKKSVLVELDQDKGGWTGSSSRTDDFRNISYLRKITGA